MIGFLKGEVFEIFDNSIILLVNDVGYKVFPNNIEHIKKGDSASYFITTIIKEDAFDLYGFKSIEEKKLFDLIVSISGIGPKTAIVILSKHKIDDVMNAVVNSEDSFFGGIPRLGKKNAQKLIIELKSKVGTLTPLSFSENSEREELVMALKGFGYQEREIMPILSNIDKNAITIEQKITFALKSLGKK